MFIAATHPPLFFLDDSPNGYSWLVKIMKQSGPSPDADASLLFFHNEIIPLARRFDVLVSESNDSVVRKHQAVELWSLFPYFCVAPHDLVTTLPNLSPVLIRAMKDKKYPQLLVRFITNN